MIRQMVKIYESQPAIIIAEDLDKLLELNFGFERGSAEHNSIKQGFKDAERGEFNPLFIPQGEDPRHFNLERIKHHQELYDMGYHFRQTQTNYV